MRSNIKYLQKICKLSEGFSCFLNFELFRLSFQEKFVEFDFFGPWERRKKIMHYLLTMKRYVFYLIKSGRIFDKRRKILSCWIPFYQKKMLATAEQMCTKKTGKIWAYSPWMIICPVDMRAVRASDMAGNSILLCQNQVLFALYTVNIFPSIISFEYYSKWLKHEFSVKIFQVVTIRFLFSGHLWQEIRFIGSKAV